MRRYDIIMAGAGAAGLSLAFHLSQSSLRDRSILLIDRQVKVHNDHTWCSWLKGPAAFDEIAFRTWDTLRFVSDSYDAVFPLAPYRYRMLRGVDFYRYVRQTLSLLPHVDFLLGDVERVVDGHDHAEVHVNAMRFEADWVFDSRYASSEYRPLTSRYHYLAQHFLGWEIETDTPAFDPGLPRLFDFRTPQRGALRFLYLLPYSESTALVEYTLFSPRLLQREEYEEALRDYITDELQVKSYRILDEESDLIPMTDQPFPRRAGRRIMNIGTRGGLVKGATGYAFSRIQRDCRAIVRSLEAKNHPFNVPAASRRYRFFDALLLDVLEQRGGEASAIFTEMFRHNPIGRNFRFLDEEDGIWSNLRLINTLPKKPFLAALMRYLLRPAG